MALVVLLQRLEAVEHSETLHVARVELLVIAQTSHLGYHRLATE